MAIFERRNKPKTTLDDTQSLICTIETAQKVNGHTVRFIQFHLVYHSSSDRRIVFGNEKFLMNKWSELSKTTTKNPVTNSGSTKPVNHNYRMINIINLI